jgi:hypothetical protein
LHLQLPRPRVRLMSSDVIGDLVHPAGSWGGKVFASQPKAIRRVTSNLSPFGIRPSPPPPRWRTPRGSSRPSPPLPGMSPGDREGCGVLRSAQGGLTSRTGKLARRLALPNS